MNTLPGSKDYQDAKQRLENLKRKVPFHVEWLMKLKREALDIRSKRPLNQKESISRSATLKFKEQQIQETQRMINYLEAKVRYLETIIED